MDSDIPPNTNNIFLTALVSLSDETLNLWAYRADPVNFDYDSAKEQFFLDINNKYDSAGTNLSVMNLTLNPWLDPVLYDSQEPQTWKIKYINEISV